MRQWMVALVAVLVGCVGTIEDSGQHEGRTYTARIDSAWTADQREQIELGIAFWQGLIAPRGHTIRVVVGPCEVNEVTCLTRVAPEDPSLLLADGWKVGVQRDGAIVMSEILAGEELALVTAHELGHRFGLGHANECASLMFEATWGAGWSLDAESEAVLERRGLL